MRGLAALWVVYFHISHFWIPSGHVFTFSTIGPLEPLLNKGHLGVDTFFMLSGFVIAYVYRDSLKVFSLDRTKKFLLLRIARIFPVHYATIILVALLNFRNADFLRSSSPYFSPLALLYNLLNVQDWEVTSTLTWNYPAWSVSAEWLAYLLFPFLNIFLSSLRCVFFNSLIVILAFVSLLVFSNYNQNTLDWTVHLGATRALIEFVLGYGLNGIVQELRARENYWIFRAADLTALATSALLVYLCFTYLDVQDVTLVSLIALILGSVALSSGVATRVLSLPPLIFLGEISYSIYMLHFPIQTLFFVNMPPARIENMLLPNISVLVTVVAAYVLYTTLENPTRKWVRRKLAQSSAQ